MDRHSFHHDGLTLSYLDAGGGGEPMVALHAHWMEARTYAAVAQALAPRWRVVALDQRGHGDSDHASRYRRDDYLGDLSAFLDHLKVERVVLLGNSLGGLNAYQFAARRPERVRALVIEDIGAVLADDTSFVLPWGGVYATREALAGRIGPRLAPYLIDSFRHTPEGWRLAFDPRDMVASQHESNGEHWEDWLASTCPALLIRGADSRVTSREHLEEMAARRPGTRFVELPAGHVVHADDPTGFVRVVREFLETL
jgi:esterase